MHPLAVGNGGGIFVLTAIDQMKATCISPSTSPVSLQLRQSSPVLSLAQTMAHK